MVSFSRSCFQVTLASFLAALAPDGSLYGCYHDFDTMASMFSASWTRVGTASLAAGGGELADPTMSFPNSMHGGATPDGRTVVGFYTDMMTGKQHGYVGERSPSILRCVSQSQDCHLGHQSGDNS